MTRPIFKYLTFGFLLSAAAGYGIALAEDAASGLIVRPVMEYKSDKLRDPFKNYLTEEKPEPVTAETPVAERPQLDLSKFQVTGIIWGGRMPQAIINGHVLTIGDKLGDVEIISIEKKGITISYGGEIFDLSSPGLSPSAPATAENK
jgi:hypothetical protein